MDEKLEKLIDFAVVDGVLTEKEKLVLFKKAQELGVDQDEFEMILDAKLHMTQKANIQAAAPPPPTPAPVSSTEPTKPKSQKKGDIKKCPSCGAPSTSFSATCSDCGHEFSNIEVNNSINKLFEMLNDAEDMRKQDSNSNNPLKAFGGAFADALSDMRGPGKVDRKKMAIISNFPIPTTRGDILEFLSLALPKAKKSGNFFTKNEHEHKTHNDFVPIWKTKCEQIILKARFSMKEDKRTLDEINHYANEIGIN